MSKGSQYLILTASIAMCPCGCSVIVVVKLVHSHFKGKENDMLVHSHVCNCILMLWISTHKHETVFWWRIYSKCHKNAKARLLWIAIHLHALHLRVSEVMLCKHINGHWGYTRTCVHSNTKQSFIAPSATEKGGRGWNTCITHDKRKHKKKKKQKKKEEKR